MLPVSPVQPVLPVTPVAPVFVAEPAGPVIPVGPSIPSKFTLYTAALLKSPAIFVIWSTVRLPVLISYELTLPSNLIDGFPELTTTTEFPGIYDRPVTIVRLTDRPSIGLIVVELDALKYLSPAIPVGPVTPVAPV